MICNFLNNFVFLSKVDFDPDPGMDPDSDSEITGKSDPEIILSDPTHCLWVGIPLKVEHLDQDPCHYLAF